MKVLLDTHAILWFIEGDQQMSPKAREVIENTDNQVLVSAISLFEIAIKLKLGKLLLGKPLELIFQDILTAGIVALPIENKHLLEYQNLVPNSQHRDPFDRLIISTAISEKAVVISADRQFTHYEDFIEILW